MRLEKCVAGKWVPIPQSSGWGDIARFWDGHILYQVICKDAGRL